MGVLCACVHVCYEEKVGRWIWVWWMSRSSVWECCVPVVLCACRIMSVCLAGGGGSVVDTYPCSPHTHIRLLLSPHVYAYVPLSLCLYVRVFLSLCVSILSYASIYMCAFTFVSVNLLSLCEQSKAEAGLARLKEEDRVRAESVQRLVQEKDAIETSLRGYEEQRGAFEEARRRFEGEKVSKGLGAVVV